MVLVGARYLSISPKLNLGKPSFMLINLDSHRAYVEFSKDESPIHISRDFANQMGFNGLVVHGSHLLEIALIEFFEKQPKASISFLRVDFIHSICVDEEFSIEMSLGVESGNIWLVVEGTRRVKIKLIYGPNADSYPGIGQKKASEFYKNASNVSWYVGMIDPGDSAIFRQIEVFTDKPPLMKAYGENVRGKDHDYVDYIIRSTALVNRLVTLDDEILESGQVIRNEISEGDDVEQTFLIVGFGTLGKVILQVLKNLGYRVGYVLTSKPTDAENFLHRSSHNDLDRIQILNDYSKLPLKANIIIYTSSPKIEIESKDNSERLKEIYENVYHDNLLSLLTKVEHQKLFYPSTTYVDSTPDDFKEYVSVKLKTEIKLQKLNDAVNKDYLILRLPPFKSRHHSILIKSHKEIGIEELTRLLDLAFRNWLIG
jgi:hypothetical protein